MDRNEVTRLMKEVPVVSDKSLPDIQDRKAYLDTQIAEYKKLIYRKVVEIEVAKGYLQKSDTRFQETGETQIRSTAAELRALIASLSIIRSLRVDLQVELDKAKGGKKEKKEINGQNKN